MRKEHIIFWVLTILLFAEPTYGQIIHGRVKNERGEPLGYANVYENGTTNGTTTNEEGYYKIELTREPSELVFKFLGYQTKTIHFDSFSVEQQKDVTLTSENYTIQQVVITAGEEDPAYEIIRKAIAKRKYFLQEVKEYSCDVYIKGIQKIIEYPKRILGIKVDLSEFVDEKTGIIYLSESVSKYNFKYPDKVHEEMISSKVSGSNKSFSFNQAASMDLNFYENLLDFGDISQRGFVSPLASNALFFYKYQLEATYVEDGVVINKIKVIPRRKNDPVFRGHIFIQDSTWRLHGAGLWITKEAQIEFVDSLYINQVYIPVDNTKEIWMRGSASFHFGFSFMGFKGGGDYLAVYSKYNVTPMFPKKLFSKGEFMKVQKGSNKRDSVYWQQIRPVPLTNIEIQDYTKRDSLRVLRESDVYLDSLDHRSNKPEFGNLLTGYTFRNRKKKTSYSVSSPINSIQFNTVEGWNAALELSKTKDFEDRKEYRIFALGRYGFSNERLNLIGGATYQFNPKRFGSIGISGGTILNQFNEDAPITPLINTIYSLADRKNYMKLYRKDYISLDAGIEVFNGFKLDMNLTYAERSPVENTTDYSFSKSTSRDYTTNTPLNLNADPVAYEANTAFLTTLNITYVPGQQYISRPDIKYILGSPYPKFGLNVCSALKNVIRSDDDFLFYEFNVTDDLDLGLIGTFEYRLAYGSFLNSSPDYFYDFRHFNGNQTIVSSFSDRRFENLDYYAYSTNDNYFTASVSHGFGGFILNKVPLLRKLKLNEVVSARYLRSGTFNDHFEVGFGLEKLGFIRVDFVTAFDENGHVKSGVVFGFKGLLGPE